MTLIRRNLEQMRRLAVEEHKKKHEPKYINRTQQSNFMSPMKIDIASMRNSVAEQKINNYLSDEVAEEELTSTLTHYQMIKIKERVKDFISKVTQRTPNAFTMRTTAEFLSDFINNYNIEKDIK
ncbi:hypothetical protein N8975_05520 [Candidatus Pelagibacter ubique]|nr:hypothetical protein [Candidatus Pelagibacter ubique]